MKGVVKIVARKKVATEPTLRDWAAVDTTLRDIRECRHALVELGVERDRRIDGIKDEFAQTALPLQNRIKRLEADVKEYADAHRAELPGKSRKLTFGTIGYRASSRLVLAANKAADAIEILKGLGKGTLIKTTETLDRESLKRQPLDVLEAVGAYVKVSDEFYYDISDETIEV
jgi:phage host-nuclease inhibitor protein Gam